MTDLLSQARAGGRAYASQVRNVAPLSAYKSIDQDAATAVGTLGDDDALLLSLSANTVYFFVLMATFTGGTAGSSDLLTGWSYPSGTTMTYEVLGTPPGGSLYLHKSVQSDTRSFQSGGSGTESLMLFGTIATAGTEGTLNWMWCQNSGSAVTTTVHAGSVLAAWKAA